MSLIDAATDGNTDLLLLILKSGGVDLNATDWDGGTALHCAALQGHSDAVRTLIDFGANVHLMDNGGMTALHCAANYGHCDVIEILTDIGGAEINHLDSTDGTSPLMKAVLNWHDNAVQMLIQKGSDLHARDSEGWTALHIAAMNCNNYAVLALVKAGADKTLLDHAGKTALDWATQKGFSNIVQTLQC